MRRPTPLLLLAAASLLLGCQPKAPASAPAPAATPAASSAAASSPAAGDDAAVLMAAAFPGWTAAKPYPIDVPSGTGQQQERVLVSPALVASPDADHRLLIAAGVPDDGNGQPAEFHAASAHLGVYAFERREGRWAKTLEHRSLTWSGAYGRPGELKVHPFGPQRLALTLEEGDCGQDYCSNRLRLFAIGAREVHALAEVNLGASATDATAGCDEFLAGQPLTGATVPDPPLSPDNCYAIEGRWRFEPGDGRGWPDLVVNFSGSRAVLDAATGPLRVRVVDDQLVLRHDGTAYRRLSGRNPLN